MGVLNWLTKDADINTVSAVEHAQLMQNSVSPTFILNTELKVRTANSAAMSWYAATFNTAPSNDNNGLAGLEFCRNTDNASELSAAILNAQPRERVVMTVNGMQRKKLL